MAKKRIFQLLFPEGGLHRRYAFQQQPPFTTADAQNVRPDSVVNGRQRGGSRPGLDPYAYEDTGTDPRMIATVIFSKSGGERIWADNFEGQTLGAHWSTASWLSNAPKIISANFSGATSNSPTGAVRSALTAFDTGADYDVELFITPFQARHDGRYSIFLRMNDGTPVLTTDGVEVALSLTDTGNFDGEVLEYVSGVKTTKAFTGGGTDTVAKPGWFRVNVSGNTLKAFWRGNLLITTTLPAPAGKRFGFGINCTLVGGLCLVDTFRIQYEVTTVGESPQQVLLVSTDGTLFKEGPLGVLTDLAPTVRLNANKLIQAQERTQKLYIADHGDLRVKGTDGVVAGTSLDAASVPDWTALGIDTDDDVVVLFDASGATNGTFKIASVAVGNLTLASSAGTGTASYRVQRAPKVFDPNDDSLAIWFATASKGQVPSGCPLIALYRDRLVLAGSPDDPHAWFMSRQADAFDWLFTDTDAGAAVVGTNADAGLIGQPITALANHSDDYLVFGCTNSIWVLRGDPNFGGDLNNLSHGIGIIGHPQNPSKAWCHGPNDELIFLSSDGLYMIPPGGNSYPESISRERLPNELLNVDPGIYTVNMAYDVQDRGVHIFLTADEFSQDRLHFWFDWETKSFWPVSLKSDHDPTVVYEYTSFYAENSSVLLGCRDGFIRRFRRGSETDEGTEISSFLLYGPLKLGNGDLFEGVFSELQFAGAQDGGDVDFDVLVGQTAEQAFNASARETGSWNRGGLNFTSRPRARGHSCFIKLKNGETNRAWGIESLSAVARQAGRRRVRA